MENKYEKLNSNIHIMNNGERKTHSKASEEYVHVQFQYDNTTWDGWVPVEYRRTGVSIQNDNELYEHLKATSENRFAFSVFRKCSCFRIKIDANIGIFKEGFVRNDGYFMSAINANGFSEVALIHYMSSYTPKN